MSQPYPLLRVAASLACALLFALPLARASSVVPPEDLRALASASEAIVIGEALGTFEERVGDRVHFGYELRVGEVVRGSARTGQVVRVRSGYELILGPDRRARVEYGFALESGAAYAVFLADDGEAGYMPVARTFGVYGEVELAGKRVFSPLEAGGALVAGAGHDDAERIAYAFPVEAFAEVIRRTLAEPAFEAESVGIALAASSLVRLPGAQARPTSAPAYCSYFDSDFGGALPLRTVRWNIDADPTIEIRLDDSRSPATIFGLTVDALLALAITEINTNYPAVTLIQNPLPVSVTGAACFSQAVGAANTGEIVVVTGGCNTISSCAGGAVVLGTGGPSWSSATHTADGVTYYTIQQGGVAINGGAENCLSNAGEYVDLLVHELTHALSLNHIPTSQGVANMNPSCCSDITALDQACVNALYASSPLPVELAALDAEAVAPGQTRINWRTASERDAEAFAVERSRDGEAFVEVGRVGAAGESTRGQAYDFTDYSAPAGTSYYRLAAVDRDGLTEYSGVVSVVHAGQAGGVTLLPNPVGKDRALTLDRLPGGLVNVVVTGADGRIVHADVLASTGGRADVQLPRELPGGLYALTLRSGDAVETLRVSLR